MLHCLYFITIFLLDCVALINYGLRILNCCKSSLLLHCSSLSLRRQVKASMVPSIEASLFWAKNTSSHSPKCNYVNVLTRTDTDKWKWEGSVQGGTWVSLWTLDFSELTNFKNAGKEAHFLTSIKITGYGSYDINKDIRKWGSGRCNKWRKRRTCSVSTQIPKNFTNLPTTYQNQNQFIWTECTGICLFSETFCGKTWFS